MLNTEIERKLSMNLILFMEQFLQKTFFGHYTSVWARTQSHGFFPYRRLYGISYLSLCVSLCLWCSAYFSVECAGVSVPPALHMVKISEGNQEPSRSGLGPWHCPGLGVGRCLSGASLWGLSALKNLFVYPRVRSGFRSRALLLSAHQGPGLLPLATDKNCC